MARATDFPVMEIANHRFSYSPEFVAAVKKAFPKNKILHEQIDSGSIWYVEQAIQKNPALRNAFNKLWRRR